MNASQSLRRLVIASFLLFSFFLTEFLFSRPANISLFKSITSPGVAVAVSAHVTQAQRNIHAAGKQHSRTQTHTHTRPPRRHALKTKSSASRCSPRSQMRGQIVFCFFFLPNRIRTLMFLSVAHADALNSLAHRAAVPAPLGSETRAPSL